MTWLDWIGASFCFLAVVGFLAWVFNGLHEAWPRSTELPAPPSPHGRPRSPMQMYLDGGGDLSNPRVVALLAEAERGWNRHHAEHSQDRHRAHGPAPHDAAPLHAHQVAADDAAMIRMMAGAHFGLDATVTLPSGRTVTGTEMRQWIETNEN